MVKQLNYFYPFIFVFLVTSCGHQKDALNVAVASNFEATLQQLIILYRQQQPNTQKINIISGSSGVLANQIIHNAPFDIFLSADQQKTDVIIDQLNLNITSKVYAIGQLALWIPDVSDQSHCIKKLHTLKSVAIANPETAPYGFVAQRILQKQQVNIEKTIHTSNVSQAYLYTKDKLTEAGFIAKSLIQQDDNGCIQTFNDNALKQNMLLLSPHAKRFYDFILSEKAQSFIQHSGYRIES